MIEILYNTLPYAPKGQPASPKTDMYLVGVRDCSVVFSWAAVGRSVLVHGWCGRSLSQQAALWESKDKLKGLAAGQEWRYFLSTARFVIVKLTDLRQSATWLKGVACLCMCMHASHPLCHHETGPGSEAPVWEEVEARRLQTGSPFDPGCSLTRRGERWRFR